VIDLRSDTVTRPSDAMRAAMAGAAVGDDLYGEDPTVIELETTVAGLLGKDWAVYVPTGTMANQIAVRVHTQPGDTVILEAGAHIGNHEMGAAAHHSGVTLKRLAGTYGTFTAGDLTEAIPVPHPSLPSHLYDPHTLVCVENTHNDAGGTIWDLDQLHSVAAVASDHGLARHLDGSRLWNASVASGIDVSEYAAPFDTITVCFSKGLGAPVGSALVGSGELVGEARRFKQMFGGGFRQAGIVAAGALYAVTNNRERLVEDHRNARVFAEALAATHNAHVDLDAVQTNLVYFDVPDPGAVVAACLEQGVSMLVLGPTRIRAVFHLDVSSEATATAITVVTGIVDG
jgi:threonine aldolase